MRRLRPDGAGTVAAFCADSAFDSVCNYGLYSARPRRCSPCAARANPASNHPWEAAANGVHRHARVRDGRRRDPATTPHGDDSVAAEWGSLNAEGGLPQARENRTLAHLQGACVDNPPVKANRRDCAPTALPAVVIVRVLGARAEPTATAGKRMITLGGARRPTSSSRAKRCRGATPR